MAKQQKDEPGTKYDSGKPAVELLAPDALLGIGRVLAFGAAKYDARNWEKGMSWSRIIGALLRHTFEIMKGNDTDPESGLPHVDHLGCCWMFLSAYMKRNIGTDDRK